MKRKVTTDEFFATRPVFSLEEATSAMTPPGGRAGTVERLKHHLETGRLSLVARGVYAVVPAGAARARFHPDPFLVAAAARPEAVFSHHSALELLGAAHSVWRECTAYTPSRGRQLVLDGTAVRFLDQPRAMRDGSFATRRVERRGRILRTTGPERTLVEGFRKPALAGGLEELVVSASGFPTLDLDLLERVLERYGLASLWAATAWFLDRFRRTFHVPDRLLDRMARNAPSSPRYLERGRRGGTLASPWNLIVPDALNRLGGPDERRP